ncbi:MAG: hypothetical protein LM576_02630 [Thermofilum sp.]|nr:hypothetical protein [Thermofilum sp.]
METGAAQAERGRFHPAVFTLVVALLKGDLSLVGDPERVAEAYRELGFEVTPKAAWEHRRWLVAKGYVVVARTARGREVWLAERGLELAKKLGLDGRLPPAAVPPARGSQQLLG